jgi:hypothetical protein
MRTNACFFTRPADGGRGATETMTARITAADTLESAETLIAPADSRSSGEPTDASTSTGPASKICCAEIQLMLE